MKRRTETKVFGCSKQLLLNKYFDPSTPSMRKGESRERKKEKTDENRGHYVIASRLQLHLSWKLR